MIQIIEVKTKKQQRAFCQFPIDLYKENDCFVPPLWMDEMKMFKPGYVYHETCESIYFLAYDGEKLVGRIQGILQKAANEKWNQKRVRFTRFDAIDDQEVANALFSAVEVWAKKKGMTEIVGPLGYSDFEREGLLVEGFEELSTFEEQYNYAYYQKLIESYGFVKETGWLEHKLYMPDVDDGKMEKMEELVMKRFHLHYAKAKNITDLLNRYDSRLFQLIDTTYDKIYGTAPITEGIKDFIIGNFKMIADTDHVYIALDENENLVAFGICIASIVKAVQKSDGHLTPATLVRILKSTKHPEILELCLVGVAPDYLNNGVIALVISKILKMLREDGVQYCETNLNLEDNHAILNMWKRFKTVQHKKRNCYLKTIC